MKEFVIEMIAGCLAKKFIKPLFLFSTERNYAAYVGGLAEILDWATEFYDLFNDKIITWEIFENENDNRHKTVTLDDLIIAFGYERIKRFYAQNPGRHSYFIDKYSVIELQK